jgi:hypothetical protein
MLKQKLINYWPSKIFTGLVVLIILSGCSLLPAVSEVKPWEKAVLAKPEMMPGGLAEDASLVIHVYAAREASKGGEGVGGGGCGCK